MCYGVIRPRNDISETKKNPAWKTRFIFSSGNGWRPCSGIGCCMYRLALIRAVREVQGHKRRVALSCEGKAKVITLGSILLILQILHVSLRIIVVIRQLTGRP